MTQRSLLLTDTKHRAASLRQQSYLFIIVKLSNNKPGVDDTSAVLEPDIGVAAVCRSITCDFIAARCYASAAYALMRCVSVSVTFMHSVKMNKHIFKFLSPSCSHTILVFVYQPAWQYSDGNPPNGGVECRWGRQKSRFLVYIWLDCLLLTRQQAMCCQHGRRWTTATASKL